MIDMVTTDSVMEAPNSGGCQCHPFQPGPLDELMEHSSATLDCSMRQKSVSVFFEHHYYLGANLIHILQTKILPKYSHALAVFIPVKQSSPPWISHPASAMTIFLLFLLLTSPPKFVDFYCLLLPPSPLPAKTLILRGGQCHGLPTLVCPHLMSPLSSPSPGDKAFLDSPLPSLGIPPSYFSVLSQATPHSLSQATSYPTSVCENLLENSVQDLSSSHLTFSI